MRRDLVGRSTSYSAAADIAERLRPLLTDEAVRSWMDNQEAALTRDMIAAPPEGLEVARQRVVAFHDLRKALANMLVAGDAAAERIRKEGSLHVV
ncbi:MAG: hypothetical protein RLZ85_692 [Verrucomicrobiota bacterium]|jgi:hypothetical protein